MYIGTSCYIVCVFVHHILLMSSPSIDCVYITTTVIACHYFQFQFVQLLIAFATTMCVHLYVPVFFVSHCSDVADA